MGLILRVDQVVNFGAHRKAIRQARRWSGVIFQKGASLVIEA